MRALIAIPLVLLAFAGIATDACADPATADTYMVVTIQLPSGNIMRMNMPKSQILGALAANPSAKFVGVVPLQPK